MKALPIDDVIMPRIESGKWRAFPYTPRASSGVPVDASGVHKYKYHDKGNTLDNLKEKLQTAQLHQLDQVSRCYLSWLMRTFDCEYHKLVRTIPAVLTYLPISLQFDFQHGVAVLLDRSSFLTYGSAAIKAYSGEHNLIFDSISYPCFGYKIFHRLFNPHVASQTTWSRRTRPSSAATTSASTPCASAQPPPPPPLPPPPSRSSTTATRRSQTTSPPPRRVPSAWRLNTSTAWSRRATM